ncbi:uncharacterized protein LOC124491894 [Dermatophagoides farinae]|uniref:uncharacterized protein LOC124491894 n=1 Tax=Dermatophagoides farinae TaxID=6954 RepID=UPI003F63195A
MKFSIVFFIFLIVTLMTNLCASNETNETNAEQEVIEKISSINPVPVPARLPRQQRQQLSQQQQKQQDSPINSAIEMLNMVTKFTTQTNEMYQAAQKLAKENGFGNGMVDPITFIPSIIIYGAIKIVSYLVSTFIYASSLIAPWQMDPNAKISFIDLESLNNIDYDTISNSVRSVPERSFKLLDIREEECKSRAMCEIGQHIHSYWPRVATYIRLAVDQLNVASDDNNTMAMLRGLGWADCEETFRQSQCQRSPFRKFYQILTSLQKLLQQHYYQY